MQKEGRLLMLGLLLIIIGLIGYKLFHKSAQKQAESVAAEQSVAVEVQPEPVVTEPATAQVAVTETTTNNASSNNITFFVRAKFSSVRVSVPTNNPYHGRPAVAIPQ